jgi:ligand-binding sensor domain-containing protein
MNFRPTLLSLLITLFLLSSVLFSQPEIWKHFDKSNSGLPTNTIRSVTQDAKGNYWICRWDAGQVKYDAKSN